MASSKNILTSSLEAFELLHWNGQPVYQYYPRIKSYISTKLSKEFEQLLAQPKLNRSLGVTTSITWQSDIVGAQALSELTNSPDYAKLRQQVDDTLAQINGFIEELLASTEDSKKWGALLQLCFANVSDDTIFLEGDKMVIAGWGIKPLSPTTAGALTKAIASPEESAIKEGGPAINQEAPEETPAVAETVQEVPEEQVPDTIASEDTASTPTEEETPELPASEQAKPSNDIGNSNTIPPDDGTEGKPFWDRFNFWWLLLLLLLLLLLPFLWRTCTAPNIKDYLPPLPNIIIPIDSTDVVPDKDSIRLIVSDRLNVILRDKETTIEEFAKAFKAIYKENTHTILYYDTLTRRVQIQVPSKDREQLIEEIPKRLPQFKMLIWHESIFSRNATPSEPDFLDAAKAWYIDIIKAKGAWEKSYGSSKVVVAIIDDGFDLSHPEFANKVVKPWNVMERTTDVFTYKASSHGTHVAGTAIGVRDNQVGLSGIAPDCQFMPIQVADRNGLMGTTGVIDAILYAVNQGADVINLSLGLELMEQTAGYPVSVQRDIIANSFQAEEVFWKEILDIAESNGVVVVMAGGNNNILIGLDPMQRSPTGIKVSAIGPQLTKASFSNFGEYATISAPGVNIYSSVPSSRYAYKNGTSMAAPIVTGAVALLKSMQPTLEPSEIRNLLVNTSLFLSKEIGPLLQLDKAVTAIADSTARTNHIIEDCTNIQTKIDSLLREIERLKNLCPDAGSVDTMKMPEVIEDLDFSIGRWKSTTTIHNDSGEEVVIYFDFYKNRTGDITLVEPNGLECQADLSLTANKNRLEVNQLDAATCAAVQKGYLAYTFSCQADANGYAECVAQNKTVRANRFRFKLVKIQ